MTLSHFCCQNLGRISICFEQIGCVTGAGIAGHVETGAVLVVNKMPKGENRKASEGGGF
jgi:hypothetical protein